MARISSSRVDPVEVEQLHRAGVAPVEIAAELQLPPAAVASALKQAGRADLARPFWFPGPVQAQPRCRCGASTDRPGELCGRCVRVRHGRARRRHLTRRAAYRAWLRQQRTPA